MAETKAQKNNLYTLVATLIERSLTDEETDCLNGVDKMTPQEAYAHVNTNWPSNDGTRQPVAVGAFSYLFLQNG